MFEILKSLLIGVPFFAENISKSELLPMVITCLQEALQLELLYSLVVAFVFVPQALVQEKGKSFDFVVYLFTDGLMELPFVSICYSSSFVRSLTDLLTFVSSVMGFYISQPTTDPPGDYFATARTLVGD